MVFTAALVILFLLKLRFPRNTPVSDILLVRYGYPALQGFRKVEHISKNLEKKKLDLNFLKCCKTYEVFPKFLKFKLYKKSLHNSLLYKSWQKKLLNLEISTKEKEIRETQLKLSQSRDHLKSLVSRLDYLCLLKFIERKTTQLKVKVSAVHDRKLHNIGGRLSLNSCDPDKVIFNYSSTTLSNREKFLLSFGLDFCLPVFKPSFYKYFLDFENLINRLKRLKLSQGFNFDMVVKCVQDVACKTFYGFKRSKVFSPIFSRADINILRSLGKKEDLVICKPDKGKGVVLLDRADYVYKMNDILNDATKFTKLVYADIYKLKTKVEDKVIRFINILVSLNIINDSDAKSLKPTGSNPATLYGMPKVHKTSVPLRPVVAAYNTASYHLAKFLVPILYPFTTNEFTVKNSYELSQYLSTCRIPDSYYMVSYDIKSLFTNVPLDETINICTNLAFASVDKFMGFTRSVFRNLLGVCVKDNLFVFNGDLYKQTDGLSMGSPLSPTFANIFLCFHEQKWLENCPPNFKPYLYRRYVDDTIVIFKDKSHATGFLEYLNRQHSNIKFTMECEENKTLPFLDLTIEKCDGGLSFSIYRKPTFSGLGTSFFSYCHFNFKLNALKTLLHRAYTLTSCYAYFHNEINFLKRYFYDNGYSNDLFYKLVNRYLNNKYQPTCSVPTVDKEVLYLKIPYLGNLSHKIQMALSDSFSKFYPDKVFRFVPMNQFRISSLFHFKDRMPADLRSSIVYLFNCPSCQAGYVGSTVRSLRTRIAEHLGQSARTGRELQSPPHSAVREHCKSCKVSPNRDHFSILDTCPSDSIRILESLYIKKLNPLLNNTLSSFPLNIA